MKIKGTNRNIWFDLENGYVLKANGEILIGNRFLVYKDSMKYWEPPHEKERLTESEIQKIIDQVIAMTNENTVQILFD